MYNTGIMLGSKKSILDLLERDTNHRNLKLKGTSRDHQIHPSVLESSQNAARPPLTAVCPNCPQIFQWFEVYIHLGDLITCTVGRHFAALGSALFIAMWIDFFFFFKFSPRSARNHLDPT